MPKLTEDRANKAYAKLEIAMLAMQEEVEFFKNVFPVESSKLALDNAVSTAMSALEDVDSDISAYFAK